MLDELGMPLAVGRVETATVAARGRHNRQGLLNRIFRRAVPTCSPPASYPPISK